MIVYRDQRYRLDPRPLLEQLHSSLEHLDLRAPTSHDATVDLFIRAGTLESAVADAIFPTADGIHPLAEALRAVSVRLGHVLWHSWHEARSQAEQWQAKVSSALTAVPREQLPAVVELTVPEGFAYYSLYPEAYLEAARSYHATLGIRNTVCIGLRSIGATLSSAVAAALEELGRRVRSYTLRPRGHPFSREPVVTPALEQLLLDDPGAHFLLVDEGPGISGSSLGGTAELLGRLGVTDDRIVVFPSWKTDGSQLRSAAARERWPRHRQFVCSFEELWLETGRLRKDFEDWCWHDVSAGAWREKLYHDRDCYPAVQPQHERRKYLLQRRGGTLSGAKLISFSGLGERSGPILQRAAQLGDAGFTPPPEGIVRGFLIRPLVPGVPVDSNKVDTALVDTVSSYLAHLASHHPAEPTVSGTCLREMVETNVAEGLGQDCRAELCSRVTVDIEGVCERPVALDGRMLLHEWIRTREGYLKTDAFDHHDDHFFPGCQDIAWDLAAAALELDLDRAGRCYLLDRYSRLSQDRSIQSRLPAYAVGYLAFRVGYTTLAATVLGETDDGLRFAAEAERYRWLLRREVTQRPDGSWYV